MYLLSKRTVGLGGPHNEPLLRYTQFQLAWAAAIRMFSELGFTIIGCHLQPEFPHHPAYAEFFVTNGQDIHETYVISSET